MQREQDYLRYQEYLAHRRDELAMDLGTAAMTIVTGGAISERPAIVSPERLIATEVPVETRRPLGATALSHELSLVASRPTPVLTSPEVYTGYAQAA